MIRRGATVVGAIFAAAALAGCDGGFLTPSKSTFAVEPASLEFGPTALALPRQLKVTVKNEGRAPFLVLNASIEGAAARVETFEAFLLSSGGTRELTVTFAPSDELALEGVLLIQTDTDSAGPDGLARVPYRGRGVKAFSVVGPARLDFGNLELGRERSLDLQVTNPTGADAPLRFAIEGADAAMFTSAGSNADLLLAPGESRAIPIVFHADRLLAATATLRVLACGSCTPQAVPLDGFGINSVVEILPTRVDFGRVPIGARAEARIVITNQGTEPLEFSGLEWKGAPGAFTFDPLAPASIPAGSSIDGTVRFAPLTTGPVPVAYLQVKVTAGNTVAGGWPMLPVKGDVGDSCVVVLPRAIDFGIVPEAMTAIRAVDLLNRCGRDVVISDQEIAISAGGFFGLTQPAQPLPIASGAKATVPLAFTPKPGSGASSASFNFKVLTGSAWAYGQVPLKGETTSFAPCRFAVAPAAIDFGQVTVGTEVTLGVSFRNTGTDQCFLSAAQLMAGSDPVFTSAGLTSHLLAPGESALMPVAFKPAAVGSYSGSAEAFLNGPGGHATVPIAGQGVQGCLVLQPANVSFGTSKLSCPGRVRTITAFNNCSGPVTITSATVGAATSFDFSVSSNFSLPMTFGPGGQGSFTVAYRPTEMGEDAAAIFVWTNTSTRPLTVGLTGRAVTGLDQTDRFFQEGQSKVDLLFVVDNSGSMMEEQAGLAQNFAAVLSSAQSSGVDYHIGVTTTGIQAAPGGWAVCPGGADGGEAGRLFPPDGSWPRVITPTTPNAAQVFANNVTVGWCHWDEQGLEAAYRALSTPLVALVDDPLTSLPNDGNAGFLRQDAKLAIIVLSDEDDSSPQSVGFYETFFKSLKGGNDTLLSFSAVVGPAALSSCPTAASSGTRYMQLAQATGGISESICTQNWAASLSKLSANAFGPKTRFPLSERPDDPAQITVQINGLAVTSGWSYDSVTNSIVFTSTSAPPAGSVIDVTYPLGC